MSENVISVQKTCGKNYILKKSGSGKYKTKKGKTVNTDEE